jgi:hypothetical protein
MIDGTVFKLWITKMFHFNDIGITYMDILIMNAL